MTLCPAKEREVVPRPRNFPRRLPLLCAARFGCGLALLACGGAGRAQSRAPFPPALSSPFTARFTPGSPLVRVGLMAWSNARRVTLQSVGGARLTGTNGEELAAGIGPWSVACSGKAFLVSDAQGHTLGVMREGSGLRLQCEETDGLACLASERGKMSRYRGAVELRLRGGVLQAVNEVALETYLRGVVSREMGPAPPEALKAQAVAARTYAVAHLGQWAANGYDVRDTTDSQVYAGANGETADADAAVSATSGAILIQNQLPIAAQFCADCGGACVPEADGTYVHDSDAHGTSNPLPPGWSFTLTESRLLALLQSSIKFSPAPPEPSQIQKLKSKIPQDPNDALDPISASDPEVLAPPSSSSGPTLDRLEIAQADASGRVLKLRCVYTPGIAAKNKKRKNKDREKSETQIRPAARQGELSGNALRRLLGLNTLKSTLFTVQKNAAGDWTFSGRGWGHGHGLCQTGAMALAAAPFQYDFRAILARYYPAAEIGRLTYLEPEDSGSEAQNPAFAVTDTPQSEAKIGRR